MSDFWKVLLVGGLFIILDGAKFGLCDGANVHFPFAGELFSVHHNHNNNRSQGSDAWIEKRTLRNRPPLASESHGKIYGGSEARLGQFPYQIYLMALLRPGVGYSCGGTIYNKNIVTTAAHCVCDYENGRQVLKDIYGVWAGITEVSQDLGQIKGQFRKVSKVIPHPDYKAGGDAHFHNDVAILVLQSPFDLVGDANVAALPLADFTLPNYSECTISGWGASETSSDPPSLLYTKVSLKPYWDCDGTVHDVTQDFKTDQQLCVGGEGHTDCHGDSGGPIACKHPTTGEMYAYGMASLGIEGQCGSIPRIYSRASFYKRWIEDQARNAIYNNNNNFPHQTPPPPPSWNHNNFPFWPFGQQSGKIKHYTHDRISVAFARKAN